MNEIEQDTVKSRCNPQSNIRSMGRVFKLITLDIQFCDFI